MQIQPVDAEITTSLTCFIKNDNFVATGRERYLIHSEGLDAITNNIDTSGIGCIQLQHTIFI